MRVKKLLVANRGEIAVRILQTAAALGIPTVAVHSEDDADCAHVIKADEARSLCGLGPAAYLDTAQLLEIARESGCDAVHPGYGFLSENAGFAAGCAREGITFVGPSVEVLEVFGDKARARERAQLLGIPVLAATQGPTSMQEARAFLNELGPDSAVMVKALAGGGGRGMRPVYQAADLAEAFKRCRSEADQAFGDGRLYVERLLPRARHIEVQLIGDGTGAVSHLWERDCSVQRRRQKLIELAPSRGLDAAIRQRLLQAAVQLGESVDYLNLGTVEFLVDGTDIAFLEVNPRLQVEHTVTEEVTGIDLVEAQLRLAGGATLAELGLRQHEIPAPQGIALQARINTETFDDHGTVRPAGGTLSRFQPPPGRGVRVDTHGYAGYRINPRYDSLLAKLVVSDRTDDIERVAARAARALAEFDVRGAQTNISLLQAVLRHPLFLAGAVDTRFVDEHLAELLATQDHRRLVAEPDSIAGTDTAPPAAATETPPGTAAVTATVRGVVAEIPAREGEHVRAGAPLLVVEAMKMEHVIAAPHAGVVHRVVVEVGGDVDEGLVVAFMKQTDQLDDGDKATDGVDLGHIRPDLAEVQQRHRIGLDEARPDAVERRRRTGQRTARENIADLCDPDSFVEYGALAIAAQRRRRPLTELIERTPADGLVAGIGTVKGASCVVMSYDYTVLAGTQGLQNHRKKDRMFRLARKHRLPVVLFAEGGGGRPGDTDTTAVSSLDEPSFHLMATLSGTVPLVAVVSGYCFAGNAALAGCCDVIIATEGASLGMGGPAMIEGGGLGIVAPDEVGPMSVQVPNGVVDILVPDEAAAVRTARRYLSYFTGDLATWECADQRMMRHLVPENRLRAYDIHPVIHTLADTGSVLELRPRFGIGIITALARIEGRSVGVLANNPRHLGGAIDADAADKAARFLQLCDAFGLPVVSLCDTPGFMVGPDAEGTATVRHFSRMFVTGANLGIPLCTVVLRKGYGLGAMAMAGGTLKAPEVTVAWPSGEFGGMGLEGAVRLGYRKELDTIDDSGAREARYRELVAEMYERGKAMSTAAAFEVDDVIDPADTRFVISQTLAAVATVDLQPERRTWVDTW